MLLSMSLDVNTGPHRPGWTEDAWHPLNRPIRGLLDVEVSFTSICLLLPFFCVLEIRRASWLMTGTFMLVHCNMLRYVVSCWTFYGILVLRRNRVIGRGRVHCNPLETHFIYLYVARERDLLLRVGTDLVFSSVGCYLMLAWVAGRSRVLLSPRSNGIPSLHIVQPLRALCLYVQILK